MSFTNKELRLRYGNYWKTLFLASISPVILQLSVCIFLLIGKIIAVHFGTDSVKNIISQHVSNKSIADDINLGTQYAQQVYNLLLGFNLLVGIGSSLCFVRVYGRRQYLEIKAVAVNGLFFTVAVSIILGLIMFLLTFPGLDSVFIRGQMGINSVNHDALTVCWHYIWPVIAFLPIWYLGNYFSCMLRSEGYNWTTFFSNIFQLLLAILLAIVFVKWTSLGITGIMVGMIVSWAVVLIFFIIFIFVCKSELIFHWKDINLFSFKYWKKFSWTGLPNLIASLSIVISIYSTTFIISTISSTWMHDAQWIIGNSSENVAKQLYSAFSPWIAPLMAVGIGVSQATRQVAGYCRSAKKNLRCWELSKRGVWINFIWLMLCWLMTLILGKYMASLFWTDALNPYYNTGSIYAFWGVAMLISLPFSIITNANLMFFQTIQKEGWAILSVSLRGCLVCIPVQFIGFGIAYATHYAFVVFLFFGLVDVFSDIILIPIFLTHFRKIKNQIFDEPEIFNNKDDETQVAKYLTTIK